MKPPPRRRNPDLFILTTAGATAAFIVALLLRPPLAALLQPDSASYLQFAAARTAGYPLFLRLVGQLPGGLRVLPAVQLALYGGAAWFLAVTFRRATLSRFAGGLLLALLLGNIQVIRLSFMVMTESVFLACLMAMLGLYGRLALSPRASTLAWAALFASCAVLVRPAGYALLVALPVAACWCLRAGVGARLTAVATVLPVLAALGCGIAAYHAEHGRWATQSFLGSNLYGKAAAIVPVPASPDASADLEWMASTVGPDRAIVDMAPTLWDRFRLLVPYYDVWRWKSLYLPLPGRTGTLPSDLATLDREMLRISLEAIRAAPAAYAGDVGLNYVALWCIPDAMTTRQLERFRAFLASLEPLPHLGDYPPWHQPRSNLAVYGLRLFMLTTLLGTVWWSWRAAAAAATKERMPAIARLAFASALMVHASFALTAAVQAGIPRYVWAVWPALCVVCAGLLFAVWQALIGVRSGVHRSAPATPPVRS